MTEYVVYIDEAGDEGIGKPRAPGVPGQSHWLALGALICSAANDLKLPTWRNEIVRALPARKNRDLHFRELTHAQRVFVCQSLAQKPLGVCVALSNKTTIPGSPFERHAIRKGYLYNWLVRWLLERVTAACARAGGRACRVRIVFSRRGGTDYESMRSYLILMRDGREASRPVRSIVWDVLNVDDVAVENHSRWAGLQLADVATSAVFSAVEPDQFGNYEQRYARILAGNLLRKSGNALNDGLTFVPSWTAARLDGEQTRFAMDARTLEGLGGQAPGS